MRQTCAGCGFPADQLIINGDASARKICCTVFFTRVFISDEIKK
jgi:hypothetical protein